MGEKSRGLWAYSPPYVHPIERMCQFIRESMGTAEPVNVAVCDECGSVIVAGDWPFCGGDSSRHRR
jgi:hypothetical protein